MAAFHVCLPEEGQTRGISTYSPASGKAFTLSVPFSISPAAGEDKSPSPGWAMPQMFPAPHPQSLEPMQAGPVRVSNVMFWCFLAATLSHSLSQMVLTGLRTYHGLVAINQLSWAFRGRSDRTWKSFSLVACWAFTSCCFSLQAQLFDSWDTRIFPFIFLLVLAYSKHLRESKVLWICVSLHKMRSIIVFSHSSPCWTRSLRRQSLTLCNSGF